MTLPPPPFTPGVYIQEIDTFPSSVAQVATAIPVFIGYTANTVPGVTKIESLIDYETKFGKHVDGSFTYESVQLFYANGGGIAYVCQVLPADKTVDGFNKALAAVAQSPYPTLIVMPDAVNLTVIDLGSVQQAALKQCNDLGDRFTILDVWAPNSLLSASTDSKNVSAQRTKLANNRDRGAIYGPWLNITNPQITVATQDVATKKAALASATTDTAKTSAQTALATAQAALAALPQLIPMPASGAVAGIYASVDSQRGVWKAPANVGINGIVSLSENVNSLDQSSLNFDTTSQASVNVIRSFTGRGTLVWGARTIAGADNNWRYVPVRRLYIIMEQSIQLAINSMVFEPNDANTWTAVKAMIENFLTGLWKEGALAGPKPEQAFRVQVGLNVTMSQDQINNGLMIVSVAAAPVRPAEFIVLQFMQQMQAA